jgi:hypothetical protein
MFHSFVTDNRTDGIEYSSPVSYIVHGNLSKQFVAHCHNPWSYNANGNLTNGWTKTTTAHALHCPSNLIKRLL